MQALNSCLDEQKRQVKEMTKCTEELIATIEPVISHTPGMGDY